MTAARPKIAWKTLLLSALGLMAFFAYIIIFNVDLLQIATTVSQANFYLYLAAAISAVLEVLLVGLAWNILLRFLSIRISAFKTFLFVWFGIYIDILIPAESISGEISKVYLVTRDQNGNTGKATATLVVQRIVSMIINAGTLLAGTALLLTGKRLSGTIVNLTLLLVGVTLLFLTLILLLCVKETWTLRIVDSLIDGVDRLSRGRWKLTRFKREVAEVAKAFHLAMKDFARAPKTLISASSLYVLAWILSLLIFYFTFLSVGYTSIEWSTIFIVGSIFAAAKSIPIGLPFEIGLPEITLAFLFYTLGVSQEIGVTVTILARILTHWMRFFIGFLVQQWIGVRVATAMGATEREVSEAGKT